MLKEKKITVDDLDNAIEIVKNIQQLKEQLIASVWKPNVKTYIRRKDKEPKRKLLISLESNSINKIIEKPKFKKKKKYVRQSKS